MRYPPYLEEEIVYPEFFKVKINHPSKKIDHNLKLKKELKAVYTKIKIKKNESVAVCVGSRGISNLLDIVKTVCSFLKEKGAKPFIVPSMGSHGGATDEGQIRVLENLGITQESIGVKIISSLEVIQIGKVFGEVPVYLSKDCLEADHSICINRIKSHTKFKGKIESGLGKMICVGMGKHKGALVYHNMALKYGFQELLLKMAKFALEKSNLLFGIGVVEDFYDETMEIKALAASEIFEKEKELLKISKKNFPKLPLKELDSLIIKQIGKEISGSGMDPNVTGRTYDYMEDDFSSQLDAKRIAILDLSEKTAGNAIGLGNADIITKKVFKKMDYEVTLMNALTSMSLRKAFIPISVRDDEMAIKASLLTLGPYDHTKARVAIIKNTKDLGEFIVSAPVKRELSKFNFDFEKVGLSFDSDNNLLNLKNI
jgi:hypothetical protein